MGLFRRKNEATESNQAKTPEQDLWICVLSKAAHDAIFSSDWFESKRAIEWFKTNRADFRIVCEMAGANPQYVFNKMVKPIKERENNMEVIRTGQRYYVKDNVGLPRGGKVFHSHYRGHYKPHSPRGIYKKKKRGRPKKKHLTGNAYYAAKAAKEMKKKNLYYQGMGAKGGRPRIYNVV